jgi:hypothetical protein
MRKFLVKQTIRLMAMFSVLVWLYVLSVILINLLWASTSNGLLGLP